MSFDMTIRVHSIAEDGLPPRDPETGELTNSDIAFIFDGCIVSGWPLHANPQDYSTPYSGYWEADSDVGRTVKFAGVTHWVEFPNPLIMIGKDTHRDGSADTKAASTP